MAEISDFAEENPWWQNKKNINEVKEVIEWDNSTVKWYPRLLYVLKLDSDVIYTMRGPRQVGKTTAIKLLIRKLLLERNESKENIFYHSVDFADTQSKELFDVIDAYLSYASNFSKRGRKYVFIDEISHVPKWQGVFLKLNTLNKLKMITFILTGSNSLDIKEGAERMPGRRGSSDPNQDKVFLPMKFSEFCESNDSQIRDLLKQIDILRIESRKNLLNQIFKGELPKEIEVLFSQTKYLNELLDIYLLTGGIPKAIDCFNKTKEIPPVIYKDHYDGIVGALKDWGRKETYFKQIISRVVQTLGTPVSWETLCKETDITKPTIPKYVDDLTRAFLLSYLYKIDTNTKRPSFGGEKKIYFTDPFFYHSTRAFTESFDNPFEKSKELVFMESDIKPILVENVVANHMTRLAFLFNTAPSFDSQESVFFNRFDEKETDFIIKKPEGKFLPIEVKFSSDIKPVDISGLLGFVRALKLPCGVVLSKNTLKKSRSYLEIPVSVFLLLI